MQYGIDISSNQSLPDFAKVKRAGYDFVIAKATEGLHYTSPDYASSRTGAVTAKLYFGGYHFARATAGDPERQADHFLATLGLQPWHLLPTLDLEEQGSEGVTNAALEDFALRFAQRVKAKAKLDTMLLYTDRNMLRFRGLDTPAIASRFRLWLADLTLGPAPPQPPLVTVLHQYDWTGHVDGVIGAVDKDRALVPLDSLRVTSHLT